MAQPLWQFWTQDQKALNWITRVVSRDGEYAMRWRYLRLLCRGCNSFSLDDAFNLKAGFAPGIRIRADKGRNMLMTDDHFLCVSDDLLQSLKSIGAKGFEPKPLPETPWHVLSITQRQPFDHSVYKPEGRPCTVCGRQGQYGTLACERQIELPSEPLTFCSTDIERGQGGFDYFVTDALLHRLREVGLKGAVFHRVVNADEERMIAERREKDPTWEFKEGSVVL